MSATVFYAAARQGVKTVPLLGPYDTYGDAEAQLDTAWRLVASHYPLTWADSYGVAAVTPKADGLRPPAGVLNDRAGTEALTSPPPAEAISEPTTPLTPGGGA